MPHSQAEVRKAYAVASGTAKEGGMSKEYAREVIRKMKGKKMASLPEHAKKPKGKRYVERAREKAKS